MSKANEVIRTAAVMGYTVDAQGHVHYNGEPRKLTANRDGYLRFTIKFDGGTPGARSRESVFVHRLAAFIRFGEGALAAEVRHLNGKRNDNTITNIAYGTHSDNMQDRSPEARKAHATLAASHKRVLTAEIAAKICIDHEEGLSFKELALKYSIGVGTAHSVVKKKHWSNARV